MKGKLTPSRTACLQNNKLLNPGKLIHRLKKSPIPSELQIDWNFCVACSKAKLSRLQYIESNEPIFVQLLSIHSCSSSPYISSPRLGSGRESLLSWCVQKT